MGYRSDVAFAVDSELAPFFTALLAKNPEVERLCRDADHYQSGFSEEGDFFMYWTSIKWYDSYPEIQAIEEFIAELRGEEESDFPGVDNIFERWRFIRIGEEATDIDEDGGGFWDVHVQRTISF